MPTNLPPDYFDAEERYREAESVAEKVACLEEMLAIMPKHKGTDHLKAELRRKISKLKASPQAKKGGGQRDAAFRISREGAGQVIIIGPTNVGKSSLVAALTNATPEVSAAPYTTWKPTPGMMPIEDIQVQLIDTPPLDREFVEPALLDLIRRSDLVLLTVDSQADPLQQLEDTVDLLKEHSIAPLGQESRFPEGQRVTFKPIWVLANKCDDDSSDENCEILRALVEGDWKMFPISAQSGRNAERLKQAVFEHLGIIRVYTKAPGKEPDLSRPFVLKKGGTVADLASKIHNDFVKNLKSARVWGQTLFEGQMVQHDHILQDGDIVELHT